MVDTMGMPISFRVPAIGVRDKDDPHRVLVELKPLGSRMAQIAEREECTIGTWVH